MASRKKRKVSASEKGKKKVGSSSAENPLISTLTEAQEARFTKDFQIKIVSTPKYGMLSSFPRNVFLFRMI